MPRYNIAFDVAHKPRGKIDENLTELRDFLNTNDFMKLLKLIIGLGKMEADYCFYLMQGEIEEEIAI